MRSKPAFAFFVLLLFSPAARAQQATARPPVEITLYVTVTNERGEWVGGLTRSNFKIREGKTEHEITSFSSNETPVSVGIMIDTSKSTLAQLNSMTEAVLYFMKASKQETEIFVMLFNTEHSILVEFTSDRDAVMKALLELRVEPKGQTALFDSIDAGLQKLSNGKHPKKALIVLSDAQDNASKQDFGEIKRKVRKSNVLLYSLNVSHPSDSASQLAQKNIALIDELTTLSGGRSMYAVDRKELFEVSYRTGEELRYQYKIEFKPAASASKPDEWRKLSVKLDVAPSIRLRFGDMRVRARTGYYYDPTIVN